MVSGRLKEIACPRRRTGRGSGGQAQVGEDLGNYPGIVDGGDERHGAATVRTVGHRKPLISEFTGIVQSIGTSRHSLQFARQGFDVLIAQSSRQINNLPS